MKETRIVMGMPIEIEIVPTSLEELRRAGGDGARDTLEAAFVYLIAAEISSASTKKTARYRD